LSRWALLAALHCTSRQTIYYIVDTSADADLIGGTGQLALAGKSLISLSQPHVATVIARELTHRQPAVATQYRIGEHFSGVRAVHARHSRSSISGNHDSPRARRQCPRS